MSIVTLDFSKEAPQLYEAARKLRDVSLDNVRLDPAGLAEIKKELLDPLLSEQQMDALVHLPKHEAVVLTGFDLSRFTLPHTPDNDSNLPQLPLEIPLIFVAMTIPSGLFVTQNHKELIGTTLQHVYPEAGREKDHSSRGIYDLSEHTDEPIFAHPATNTGLDCIYGDPKGATGMIPLPAILSRLDAEVIAVLSEPVFLFESGKTYIRKLEFFEDSILKKDDEKESGFRIKFHNNSRTTSQTEEGDHAIAALKKAIAEARAVDAFEHTLMPGDKLFITNDHGLHYRKPLSFGQPGVIASDAIPSDTRRWALRLRLNTEQHQIEKDISPADEGYVKDFLAGYKNRGNVPDR